MKLRRDGTRVWHQCDLSRANIRAAHVFIAFALSSYGLPLTAAQDVTGTFNEERSTITADADPATGSLNYRFPFMLAPGRGDAKPTLALVYSSGAGDGDAGMGWRLSTPSIERKPLSGWPTFDDTKDRFAFEGQPLVFICEVTADPCPPDEKFPQFLSHWRYYRLQVEGKFARFFLKPGGATWVMQEKGGRKRVFGVGGLLETTPVKNLTPQDGTDRSSCPMRMRTVIALYTCGNSSACAGFLT
jgi:hypothetical protein